MDEEAIFAAALEKTDVVERARYLDGACGDDQQLRRRIERLLAAHDRTGGMLDEGLALGAQPDVNLPAIDTVIDGRYRLLRCLGEGGMGTVFVAEQLAPVRRHVALKLIKPAMDNRALLTRFEAERQALALMEHPNIAKVFDAGVVGVPAGAYAMAGVGATASNLYGAETPAPVDQVTRGVQHAAIQPYFVMEFIDGMPITKYCDSNHLAPRQRLELFLPVCHAIQHAHQKGIIHRDLKPSNILVGTYDGMAVAKVIDFGLAKATGPRLTEQSLRTEVGTLVGTLEYMSPEQADLNNVDVDTRTDVYALGVVLYELLAGSVPFSRYELQTAAFTEMLRIIREVDAPKASSKLSSSEALPSVAAVRQMEPKRLIATIRGELDWIVGKCLEKDRGRRYATANGMARDIERYLADEPVEASPPSRIYRLKKFLRRHWRPVLAAAIVFFALVGGIVGTTAGLKLAADRLAQVKAEKARADEETAIAKAVDEFLQKDLLEQADIGNQPAGTERNRNVTVRELLDRASERLDTRFQGHERTEAAIRLTLGKAYRAVGEYSKAQKHLERSVQLREQKLGQAHLDTLDGMEELARLHTDSKELDAAERLHQQVLEARRAALGPEDLVTLRSVNALGMLYLKRGFFDKSEPLLQAAFTAREAKLGANHLDTLESLNDLAILYDEKGDYKRAEPLYKQARDGRRVQLGLDHPRTLDSMHGLAGMYITWGRYAEAESLYDELLAIYRAKYGADHHYTLVVLGDRAIVHQMLKQYDQAEALYVQALAGLRARLDHDHPDVLRAMQNLATCYVSHGKNDKARPLLEEALRAERVNPGVGHPTTIASMCNLAVLYRDTGQADKADSLFREAIAEAKKTHGLGHPDTQNIVSHLTILHSKQGTPQLAEPVLQEIVSFLRGQPGDEAYLLANALADLAGNLAEQQKFVDAEAIARECLAIRVKYRPDRWTTHYTRTLVGAALLGQARSASKGGDAQSVARATGLYEAAEPFLLEGYDGMKKGASQIPDEARDTLTKTLEQLVRLYEAWGKLEKAAKWRAELANEPGAKAQP